MIWFLVGDRVRVRFELGLALVFIIATGETVQSFSPSFMKTKILRFFWEISMMNFQYSIFWPIATTNCMDEARKIYYSTQVFLARKMTAL